MTQDSPGSTTTEAPLAPNDEEALRAKYLAERDKRLRDDGNEQYVEPVGQFAHYLEDPYVEPTERDPLFDEVTVVRWQPPLRVAQRYAGKQRYQGDCHDSHPHTMSLRSGHAGKSHERERHDAGRHEGNSSSAKWCGNIRGVESLANGGEHHQHERKPG